MTEKVIRRLGERLEHVFEWVNSAQTYDDIWDLCCDHGRLGLHLSKRHLSSNVYLVDKVASIIDKLERDFGELEDDRLSFITADAGELSIPTTKNTLVIIAGVGGQNLIAMLEGIVARLDEGAALDFILSPNYHMFELRAFLQARPFTLIDEAFVTENNFSHEHLWLRYDSVSSVDSNSKPVTAIGDSLWQCMTKTKRIYIGKLILHYQRMLDNNDSGNAKQALKAYQCLL
jgi:tRNA (adenine22-N1)-methyltransferase